MQARGAADVWISVRKDRTQGTLGCERLRAAWCGPKLLSYVQALWVAASHLNRFFVKTHTLGSFQGAVLQSRLGSSTTTHGFVFHTHT